MARILVIAFGNPLRCDDGLAWRVAEELSELDIGTDVQILTRHLLTPELALSVSQADIVMFIDAARNGTPGDIVSETLTPESFSSVFTHDLSPGAILSVAQELYGRCAPAVMISLCGECFDEGEVLSAAVEEKLPQVVARVSELIRATKYNLTDPRFPHLACFTRPTTKP